MDVKIDNDRVVTGGAPDPAICRKDNADLETALAGDQDPPLFLALDALDDGVADAVIDVGVTVMGGGPLTVERLDMGDGRAFVQIRIGTLTIRFDGYDSEQLAGIDRLAGAVAKARELAEDGR